MTTSDADIAQEPAVDSKEAAPMTLDQRHLLYQGALKNIPKVQEGFGVLFDMLQKNGIDASNGASGFDMEDFYAEAESCALVRGAFNDLKKSLFEQQDSGALTSDVMKAKLNEFASQAKIPEADKENFLVEALLILESQDLKDGLAKIEQTKYVQDASNNAVPVEATMSTPYDRSNENISYGVRVNFTADDIGKLGFAGDMLSNQKLNADGSLVDSNIDIPVSEIFDHLHNGKVSAQMVFDEEGYPISMFISAEETPDSPYMGRVGFYVNIIDDLDPEKMSPELCYRLDQHADIVVEPGLQQGVKVDPNADSSSGGTFPALIG